MDPRFSVDISIDDGFCLIFSISLSIGSVGRSVPACVFLRTFFVTDDDANDDDGDDDDGDDDDDARGDAREKKRKRKKKRKRRVFGGKKRRNDAALRNRLFCLIIKS